MEHQGTKTIETTRLILRKFTADDLSAIFHNWTSDEKVTEFLRWPTHKSIDITKRVLESWLLEYEKPDFYQWAVIPKEIGEPIGTISVIELNEKLKKFISDTALAAAGGTVDLQAKPLQQSLPFFLKK